MPFARLRRVQINRKKQARQRTQNTYTRTLTYDTFKQVHTPVRDDRVVLVSSAQHATREILAYSTIFYCTKDGLTLTGQVTDLRIVIPNGRCW